MSTELDYSFSTHQLDSVVENYINNCSANLINRSYAKIKEEFLRDPSQNNFTINIYTEAYEWAHSKIFENLKKAFLTDGWDVLNIGPDPESKKYFYIKVSSKQKYIYR